MLTLYSHLASSLYILLTACLLAGCVSSGGGIAAKENREAADVYLQLGTTYLTQGNMPYARLNFNKALDTAPRSAKVHSAMAYFFEKTGDIEPATRHHRRAIKLAKGKGEYANNYAAFLCRQGEFTQAERYFLKALADPYYLFVAETHENAGLCMLAAGESAQADYHFELAARNDPSLKGTM